MLKYSNGDIKLTFGTRPAGYKRHIQRQRLPITLSVLYRIHGIVNFNIFDDALFWAACCTGFYGFFFTFW